MRNIKIPGIYKHFKGALYATSFISEPITDEEFRQLVRDEKIEKSIETEYTECSLPICIYKLKDKRKYFHVADLDYQDILSKKMVGYVGITNPVNWIWLRPLDMFMSPVDKEKYPTVTQEFRFEYVEGVWKKC